MDLLLILTYGALCYAAFKFLRIPVNKWTVPTAVLGGVFMRIHHSVHKLQPCCHGRVYFVTTPILPEVKGRVIEVPVEPNTPLSQLRSAAARQLMSCLLRPATCGPTWL
jgi:multidrug resistance efflux pump